LPTPPLPEAIAMVLAVILSWCSVDAVE